MSSRALENKVPVGARQSIVAHSRDNSPLLITRLFDRPAINDRFDDDSPRF